MRRSAFTERSIHPIEAALAGNRQTRLTHEIPSGQDPAVHRDAGMRHGGAGRAVLRLFRPSRRHSGQQRFGRSFFVHAFGPGGSDLPGHRYVEHFRGVQWGFVRLLVARVRICRAVEPGGHGRDDPRSSPAGYGDSGFAITLSSGAAANLRFYQNNEPVYSHGQLTGQWQPDGRGIDPGSAAAAFDPPGNANFDSFAGVNPNGSWTLFFADLSPGGTSTINGFSVSLSAVPEPENLALGVLRWAARRRCPSSMAAQRAGAWVRLPPG